jgi:hypothetical protein
MSGCKSFGNLCFKVWEIFYTQARERCSESVGDMKIISTMMIIGYLFYCRGLIYQTIFPANSTIFFVIISGLMNQTPTVGFDGEKRAVKKPHHHDSNSQLLIQYLTNKVKYLNI